MGRPEGAGGRPATAQERAPGTAARKKTLQFYTSFGLTQVEERVWRLPRCSYKRVLPQWLHVNPRGRSLSGHLEALVADFGLEAAYRQGSARMQLHHGLALCPERIRGATLKQARQKAGELDQREPVRTLVLP